jgi:tetratricopeptide (TPR) repeat protein
MNWLAVSSLFVVAFSLAAWLEPWYQNWSGQRGRSDDILAITLGDSRRLFAKHAYVKADAYFHSGYYPSIYDLQPVRKNVMVAHARSQEHDESTCTYLGKPLDWLDAFSRHFYNSSHTHLGTDCPHAEHKEAKTHGGEEREMLPWLRLSASLDPQQIESYVIGCYWLRTRMGRVNEAEQFLREGLRANPLNCELLFELGRISYEDRKDSIRARNIWELALRQWRQNASQEPEASMLYAQILGNLARLEDEQHNYARAIQYLTTLKEVSPHKVSLENWINDLKAKCPTPN